MSNCPECCTDLTDGVQFCSSCGTRVFSVDKTQPAQMQVDTFQVAQFEADLIAAGLMRFFNRIYGEKYGMIRRIIVDLPWPPEPMVISCMSDANALIISRHPDSIVANYATPMLGFLQKHAPDQEDAE